MSRTISEGRRADDHRMIDVPQLIALCAGLVGMLVVGVGIVLGLLVSRVDRISQERAQGARTALIAACYRGNLVRLQNLRDDDDLAQQGAAKRRRHAGARFFAQDLSYSPLLDCPATLAASLKHPPGRAVQLPVGRQLLAVRALRSKNVIPDWVAPAGIGGGAGPPP